MRTACDKSGLCMGENSRKSKFGSIECAPVIARLSTVEIFCQRIFFLSITVCFISVEVSVKAIDSIYIILLYTYF